MNEDEIKNPVDEQENEDVNTPTLPNDGVEADTSNEVESENVNEDQSNEDDNEVEAEDETNEDSEVKTEDEQEPNPPVEGSSV